MSVRTVALSAALSTVLTSASTLAQAACEGTSPEFCGRITIGGALTDLSRHENGGRSSLSGSAGSNASADFTTQRRILDFDEESMQPRKRVQFYAEFEDELTRHEAIHRMIMNETEDFSFDETESIYNARDIKGGFQIKF